VTTEIIRASTINGRQKDNRAISVTWTDKPKRKCKCVYSGIEFDYADGIILGAVIPQANISYLCAPNAQEARRKSVLEFQENEKNCNTCRHLKRVEFVRDGSGLMPGECLNEAREPLYPRGSSNIMFAPDDCMLQPCYEGRSK
jgi:hypothetical protein